MYVSHIRIMVMVQESNAQTVLFDPLMEILLVQPHQNGSGITGNEGVLHITQSSTNGSSPSDSVLSRTLFRRSYSSAEVQSAYSTVTVQPSSSNTGGIPLPICRSFRLSVKFSDDTTHPLSAYIFFRSGQLTNRSSESPGDEQTEETVPLSKQKNKKSMPRNGEQNTACRHNNI